MYGSSVTPRRFNRRQFIAGVAGSAAALLAACGGSGQTPVAGTTPTIAGAGAPGGTGAGSATATTAATAPRPPAATGSPAGGSPVAGSPAAAGAGSDGKIPSGVEGVPDAYTKPPAPFKSVAATPGKGGKVTTFSIAYQPPPVPREQNQYWQELEKRLGVTWEPNLAPAASYGEKSAALTAGGDLPDLFYLNPTQNAESQRKLIEQGAFTDLTPYLTGDAIKEFPNLALYQSYLWKNVAVKGKIYGVPKPVLRSGNIAFYREDWAKKLGLGPPKNADDLYNLMVGFSKGDPDGNGQADSFGQAGGPSWNASIWTPVFRVPSNWRRNADGSLTKDLETDEYKLAVDFMRRMYAGGAYHPDTATLTSSQEVDLVASSKIGIRIGGFISFWGTRGQEARVQELTPTAKLAGLIPPGHDGGKGVTYNLSGFFGFTGIPAKIRDRERVKELLRVLNYLAAPFGSDEYNFLYYGIEGVDHTVQPDGSRVVNDKGRSEISNLIYLMTSEYLFYYPGRSDDAPRAQELSKASLALGIDDPTLGFTSPTNNTKAGELRQLGVDRLAEIITGRAPLSALDQYVKDWRSRGGDQIRKEFEDALKA